MKAVLISIQPKWCELIASGKKTIEVRKTKPKLETPFKVYIYCTKERRKTDFITKSERFGYLTGHEGSFYNRAKEYDANGKVIGEFVCEKVLESFLNNNDGWFIEKGCLTQKEIDKYQGDKSILYGWHISNLVIYDKPKNLSEFEGLRKTKFGYQPIKLARPPQSWCYVERK